MTREIGDSNQTTVRLARPEDAWRVATLCHQLGYSVSQEEAQRRLECIQQDERHAVYVAELADGCVVGWVHVYLRMLLLADLQAEVGGLVVDENHRGRGIGRILMQHAEQWARGQGCEAVCVRSNVVRERAHIFYQGIGYDNIKSQRTFLKVL
jgi:GNAT superfamily N-acetyltransferase